MEAREGAHAEQIVQQIRDAFANVPQPPADALVNNHCCECAETSAAYAGKRWAEVSLEELLRGIEISLLTASAWRYYLPAFLIWTIRNPDAVGVLEDNLVFQLEPPREGRGVPEWFNERAPGFSPKQRRAIAAFLEWYRAREEAAYAPFGVDRPSHVDRALKYWTGEEP